MAGANDATLHEVKLDSFRVTGAEGPAVKTLLLSTGHELAPEEGARLMKAGILRVPRLHGVQARYAWYVRSNPNSRVADNLVPDAP